METILFLIFFPAFAAALLLACRQDKVRDIVVKTAALAVAGISVVTAVQYFSSGGKTFGVHVALLDYVMIGMEVLMAVYIIYIGGKHGKYLAPVLALVQTPLLIWFQFLGGDDILVHNNMYVDKLSVIMLLLTGITGALVLVHALGYMKDHIKDSAGEKDRRPGFFSAMFLIIAAVAGLVVSNNLIWVYLFWEIISLAAFRLIGQDGTDEAVDNAFRALSMNLLGGLSLVVGVIVLGRVFGTLEIDIMMTIGAVYGDLIAIPAVFFAFAAIIMAAQMPFNHWLLGAAAAPAPAAALLNSVAAVNAGAFLILKMAPVLGMDHFAGIMTAIVGAVTFLMAAFAAVSQKSSGRMLTYSTIACMGLIVACGGIGSPESVWAGVMLVIFHSVTKPMLFLCTGTAKHNIGSEDIEEMDTLSATMPRLAGLMMIGVAGMFLAPFGMLISKWAAVTAFADSGNVILIGVICFGSAALALCWIRWMGKLSVSSAAGERIQHNVYKDEWFAQGAFAALIVIVCLMFPLTSRYMLVPYLEIVFGGLPAMVISADHMIVMAIMAAVVILLTVMFFGRSRKKVVPVYLSGLDNDGLAYKGAMGKELTAAFRSQYMESWFGEKKMNLIGGVIAASMIVTGIGFMVGTLISLLGGVA